LPALLIYGFAALRLNVSEKDKAAKNRYDILYFIPFLREFQSDFNIIAKRRAFYNGAGHDAFPK
jgi:hypothetical protein